MCNSSSMISGNLSAVRTIHGACPHDCPDTCALQVHVKDERVVKVVGRQDHPSTHGALCTKVSRYAERTHHPERLLHPLRRVSKKTEAPRFERIGWSEALREIATRFNAIEDKQAIQPYSYAGTMGLLQGGSMADRLWNRLGAARLDRTICASAGAEALNRAYGHRLGMHLRHFADARLILIWGSNSIASNLHFWTYANQAKRNGAKLVCIDPRRSETADKCHQHVALRPGTDGALALALMHELIANDWLDLDYIEHVRGGRASRRLRERALQWPPERAAAVCALEADDHPPAGARLRHLKRAGAIRLNYGMQRVHGGANAVWLIALLPCLTGAWKRQRRRPAAQQLRLVPRPFSMPTRSSAPSCWPGASRAASIWWRSATRCWSCRTSADPGPGGLQQQPGGGGPRGRQGAPRPAARGPVHAWCSSTS
jgi:anaerobic selenocysteine-containing dehydrogenase